MTALDILETLLRDSEGCELEAYLCPAGIWTIGWGCTGEDITKGVKWTQQYADEQLHIRALEAWQEAVRRSPVLLDASPGRAAAIADFIFNLGSNAYRRSTLKKCVDKRDWKSAQVEIMRWCHTTRNGKTEVLKGLVIRRNKEAALLAGGVHT